MGKRRYRSVAVKRVDVAELAEKAGRRAIVAIDVAKHALMAAVIGEGKEVLTICSWRHPEETVGFFELCEELASSVGSVEVVMEPSGTYGDPLRHGLIGRGLPVYRVSPKKTSDAKEVYDGVPSIHDAKSAAVIGWLHLEGKSEAWPTEPEDERVLRAALRELEVHAKFERQNVNRLEGFLARHWPEVGEYLALDSATLLEVLIAYGGPAGVAADPKGARDLMRRIGGPWLSEDKLGAVLASAAGTCGVRLLEREARLIAAIAGEARRSQKLARAAEREIEALSRKDPAAGEMAPVVGPRTAAVLATAAGSPLRYDSARAYEKGLGMNLREKSSGKQKGGLHLTKRGPGLARMYLFLAALRLIKSDPVVKAWYAKKVARQGGQAKSKAVVAVMRKLVRALWHVARGKEFDSKLLFDASRLQIGVAAGAGVVV